MKTWVAAIAVLLTLTTASLRADLAYTMKVESHPSTAPPSATVNPALAFIGALVVPMIAPPGGLTMTIVVSDHGTRVDYAQPFTIVPAGGAILRRADGSLVVLNPADKTYWTMAAPAAGLLGAGVKPVVTSTRTGTFDTVAGVRAERITFEIHAALPAANAMPGFPAEIVLTGEAWVSDQYKAYAAMSVGAGDLGGLGVGGLLAQGFMVRSIVRSDLFGDQEIESSVSDLHEQSTPATFFQVPSDYHETAAPAGLPGLGGPS